MRKCFATAVLLTAWYLMLPPPIMPPTKDASGDFKMNTAAPMSQWLKFKTLKSEQACKAELKGMPSFYKCFASDDPALNKPVSAAAAPAASHAQ